VSHQQSDSKEKRVYMHQDKRLVRMDQKGRNLATTIYIFILICIYIYIYINIYIKIKIYIYIYIAKIYICK